MNLESQRQPDHDRNLDFLLDAIEHEARDTAIPEIDINLHQCDHTPDKTCLLNATVYGDMRISIYQCEDCGEELEFIDQRR